MASRVTKVNRHLLYLGFGIALISAGVLRKACVESAKAPQQTERVLPPKVDAGVPLDAGPRPQVTVVEPPPIAAPKPTALREALAELNTSSQVIYNYSRDDIEMVTKKGCRGFYQVLEARDKNTGGSLGYFGHNMDHFDSFLNRLLYPILQRGVVIGFQEVRAHHEGGIREGRFIKADGTESDLKFLEENWFDSGGSGRTFIFSSGAFPIGVLKRAEDETNSLDMLALDGWEEAGSEARIDRSEYYLPLHQNPGELCPTDRETQETFSTDVKTRPLIRLTGRDLSAVQNLLPQSNRLKKIEAGGLKI